MFENTRHGRIMSPCDCTSCKADGLTRWRQPQREARSGSVPELKGHLHLSRVLGLKQAWLARFVVDLVNGLTDIPIENVFTFPSSPRYPQSRHSKPYISWPSSPPSISLQRFPSLHAACRPALWFMAYHPGRHHRKGVFCVVAFRRRD